MSLFGWGVSNIIAVSSLVVRVSTIYRGITTISSLVVKAYKVFKDGPNKYNRILEEAKSFKIIVDGAIQYFKTTALNDQKQLEGQEILQGCQNILKDLHAFIEKYKSLAFVNRRQGRQIIKRFKLGNEDVATLRARLISNTILLSNFMRRCQHLEMQEQLTKLFGLHRTNSTVSRKSITTMAGSGGSKDGLEELCRDLHQVGVMADLISDMNPETPGIFEQYQNVASQVAGIHLEDHGQSKVIDEYATGSAILLPTLDDNTKTGGDTTVQSMFDWAYQQVNFFVEPLKTAAATAWDSLVANPDPQGGAWDTMLFMPRLKYVNIASDTNRIALHKTACKDVVDLLLENGASIDVIDGSKNALMHSVASGGDTDDARLLFENHDPVGAIGGHQFTPLHVAAREGHTEVVELLCKSSVSVDAVDKFNNTPLHLAARGGHTDVVELLLKNGASIDAMDMFKYTPLHFAAKGGHPRTVELLLDNGAKMVLEKPHYVHLCNSTGIETRLELLL